MMFKLLLRSLLINLILSGFIGLALLKPNLTQADQGKVLGIHILHPYELDDADKLISNADNDDWQFITIPLSLDNLKNPDEWQQFFQLAKTKKIIPVVRLVTKFERGNWQVPNRAEIVRSINFLSKLDWPTPQRHIIVFNEVNHATEWGGRIDPAEYAKLFRFTAEWAHTESGEYVVLPAAMDLAAPNGPSTMEAFTYLKQLAAADPEIFNLIDVWNSHSYPNPGFSSSPERTTQNSLRGFEYELAFLKEQTGRDFLVMITETGWVATPNTSKSLENYYTYALQHIWSNPQIIAVTPFVLRGDPGPFKGFTFLDRDSQPTQHYTALQNALKRVRAGS